MRLPALNETQLKELFPVLARLADDFDGVQSVFDDLENSQVRMYDTDVKLIENAIERYGELLFPTKFGEQTIHRTRLQFEIENHVTIVYEVSDNNYAACGISFHDAKPVLLHVNDRSYVLYREGDYVNVLGQALSELERFWSTEDAWISLSPTMPSGCIIPPVVDCRLGFDADDYPREVAVMSLVRSMIAERASYVADILFTSEQPGYNIHAPRFALRTYDRHSGDYTHTWNFVWRDFAVQWYGRINRSPTFNRELTQDEVIALLTEVREDLEDIRWAPAPPTPKPLTSAAIAIAMDKLSRNGQSGAYGQGDSTQWDISKD